MRQVAMERVRLPGGLPPEMRERTEAERQWCELLRTRAELLAGEERALVTMYLDGHSSFRQLARLAGTRPSTVGRRIRRILRRLADETYPLCLHNRRRFTESELTIIRDHFVRGLSVRRIMAVRQLRRYRVRATIAQARAFTRAAQASDL